MNARIVLLALAACLLLVHLGEANKFFCRPGHWKKPSDCNSFYGKTCTECCGAFSMTGRMNTKTFSLKQCICEARKESD